MLRMANFQTTFVMRSRCDMNDTAMLKQQNKSESKKSKRNKIPVKNFYTSAVVWIASMHDG